MRLFEIFDTEVRDVNLNKDFDWKKSGRINPKDELGHGIYSRVRGDPTDPHQVKKSSKPSRIRMREPDTFKDPFIFYANYVIEHKLWDYVHFPRIYKVKNVKDKSGRQLNQWKMEKLIPGMDLSDEELKPLCDRYFYKMDDCTSYDIANEIERAAHRNNVKNIKDETLAKAISILNAIGKEIFKEGIRSSFDLHAGNIMYRRTPVGLQMVFTDPFA